MTKHVDDTHAIATGTGQVRFLSTSGAWVLAPSKLIRSFPNRRDAERFVAANNGDAGIEALRSGSPMVMPYRATRVGAG
jgi:hypothetical protein